MLVLLVVMVVGCAYWLRCSARDRHIDKLTAGLPYAPGLPVIGSALMFLGSSTKILQSMEKITTRAIQNKGALKIWLGPKLYVALANPEDVQIILENCLEKDSVYRFIRPWLGDGLFVAPLGLWKAHRKVLLPVFHNRVVEEYVPTIAEQARVMVGRMSERLDGGPFDVLKYITACTLDIMFETAMSKRMDVQRAPDTPYLRARTAVMEIMNQRFFKVWLQPDCLFNLTPLASQQRESIELTHKFTDEVVRERRMEYESKKNNNIIADGKTEKKPRAVLDLLFGREIEFTDEQLREHIDSVTIAGNDTTALVIAYTLVLLGIHRDVQQRVMEEQKSIFEDSNRGATKEDLAKMQYLERVIKESMRLYTVVPIIARKVDKDVYLRDHIDTLQYLLPVLLATCEATVPAGTSVVVGAFALHRSETVWGPNAAEFDPDRFLPERSQSRHPAAFIPFSYGSRNCIGRKFGMMIMKSLISSVVRAYRLEADEVGPLKIELLLFPVNGHQLRITKREISKC